MSDAQAISALQRNLASSDIALRSALDRALRAEEAAVRLAEMAEQYRGEVDELRHALEAVRPYVGERVYCLAEDYVSLKRAQDLADAALAKAGRP